MERPQQDHCLDPFRPCHSLSPSSLPQLLSVSSSCAGLRMVHPLTPGGCSGDPAAPAHEEPPVGSSDVSAVSRETIAEYRQGCFSLVRSDLGALPSDVTSDVMSHLSEAEVSFVVRRNLVALKKIIKLVNEEAMQALSELTPKATMLFVHGLERDPPGGDGHGVDAEVGDRRGQREEESDDTEAYTLGLRLVEAQQQCAKCSSAMTDLRRIVKTLCCLPRWPSAQDEPTEEEKFLAALPAGVSLPSVVKRAEKWSEAVAAASGDGAGDALSAIPAPSSLAAIVAQAAPGHQALVGASLTARGACKYLRMWTAALGVASTLAALLGRCDAVAGLVDWRVRGLRDGARARPEERGDPRWVDRTQT